MTTQLATQSPVAVAADLAEADFAHRAVTSADGTTIGYRQIGRGPALILLHGSMSSGAYHTDLARLLADAFTVVVPDRRGRGLSGPYRGLGDLDQELQDLEAVRDATAADLLWGLSSGACIVLHAARTMPGIRKIGLFEPPLFRDRAGAEAFLRRFDREMAEGRIDAAMITAMRGAEMGPGWFRALPQWLTARLVGIGMAQEAKKPAGRYPLMRDLARTLHADFSVVTESSGRLDDYRAIGADVLLIGGSKSPAFLKLALDDLAGILPKATRVELEGQDHAASWNRDQRGRPDAVAPDLRRFLSGAV